jgi:internalin A
MMKKILLLIMIIVLLSGCDVPSAADTDSKNNANMGFTSEDLDYIIIDGEQFSTMLTELNLNHLRVTNQDIIMLQYMMRLERLVLPVVGDSDLMPLVNLTSLKSLSLSGTPNDITSISKLTNLETLTWIHSRIDDLTPLSSLDNLKILVLGPIETSDITPLSKLTNLEELFLSGHKISDLAPLSSLTNLKSLTVLSDGISDLTPLAYLTNLTQVTLSGTQDTDWSSVAHVENVTKLP